MKIEMKNWEIERIKEIVSDTLELWAGNYVEVNDGEGNSRSMNKKIFLKTLEDNLRK